MNKLPKNIKRSLRELSARAYEKELQQVLTELSNAFEEWKQEKLTTFQLTDLIHEFHNGAAQKLFIQYERGILTVNVAHAIAAGILQQDEISEEVLEHLKDLILWCKDSNETEEAV